MSPHLLLQAASAAVPNSAAFACWPWDKLWPVYRLLVTERGFKGPAAVAWMVAQNGLREDEASACYSALRSRLLREQRRINLTPAS